MTGLLKPSEREWRQGFQARRLKQVRGRIVGTRAQRRSYTQHLANNHKNDECNRKTARGRNGQWLQNILQDQCRASSGTTQIMQPKAKIRKAVSGLHANLQSTNRLMAWRTAP